MKPYSSARIGLVNINPTPDNNPCMWGDAVCQRDAQGVEMRTGQAADPDCGLYVGGSGSVQIYENLRPAKDRHMGRGDWHSTNGGAAVLEIRRRDGVVTYWVDGTNIGTCGYDLSDKTVSAQVWMGDTGDNLYNVQWDNPTPAPEVINGGWSAWSACSKPCRPVGSASSEWGQHQQTCTDPAPANGGCACPFKVTPTGRLKQVPMGDACGSGAFTPNSGWCNNHAC
jgi:hypothetical protein